MASAQEVRRGMVVLGGRQRLGWNSGCQSCGAWVQTPTHILSLMCPMAVSLKCGHKKVVRIKYMDAIHFHEAWHMVHKEG